LAQMARDSRGRLEHHRPRRLQQARDYLHAHFTQSLSLDAIAAAVCVHSAHLTRAFRQHHHCTPGEYVRHLRVDYACHLLSTSETPLSHIALQTGFADQSHFSRTFKTLTGMTPAQFRNMSGRAGLRQEILPWYKTTNDSP